MNKSQETIFKLSSFDNGTTQAERLAASVLLLRGYSGLDPSHPRGGPDGGKDIICFKKEAKYVCGVYFSKKKKKSELKKKFNNDIKGVKKNKADGFVFVTNLELLLSERDDLKSGFNFDIDIIHLESLATYLNSPQGYPIRLDHLGIVMEKEEQVAFFQSILQNQMESSQLIKKLLDGSNSESEKEINGPVYAFHLKREGSYPTSGSFGSYGTSNPEVHKVCSNCGFGYSYVDLYSGSGYISGSALIVSQNKFDSFNTDKVVQCPNCKNIEKIY